jgi:phage gp36-like protein
LVVRKYVLSGLQRYLRVSWAIAGTNPSFTFAVMATAHVIYAQPSDVRNFGMAGDVTSGASDSELADFAIAASTESDGYLAVGKSLPLTAWDETLTTHNAAIATYRYLNARGRQPEGPDDLIDLGFTNAVKWIMAVGDGRIAPPGIIDQTPDNEESAHACVSSAPIRGWF